MAGDDTMVMEWFYMTPCGRCGQDVQVGKDPSRGKVRYSGASPVRAKCPKCGHEDNYPATAIDNKAVSASR